MRSTLGPLLDPLMLLGRNVCLGERGIKKYNFFKCLSPCTVVHDPGVVLV